MRDDRNTLEYLPEARAEECKQQLKISSICSTTKTTLWGGKEGVSLTYRVLFYAKYG